MSKKTLRSFISHSIAAVFVGAAAMVPMSAEAAIWQGGDVGDINDPANWDTDVAASVMNFPKDRTFLVTQGVDAVTYSPWRADNSSSGYANATDTMDRNHMTIPLSRGTAQKSPLISFILVMALQQTIRSKPQVQGLIFIFTEIGRQ